MNFNWNKDKNKNTVKIPEIQKNTKEDTFSNLFFNNSNNSNNSNTMRNNFFTQKSTVSTQTQTQKDFSFTVDQYDHLKKTAENLIDKQKTTENELATNVT